MRRILDFFKPIILAVCDGISLPIVNAINRALFGEEEITTLDEGCIKRTNRPTKKKSPLIGPGYSIEITEDKEIIIR